MQPPSVPAHFLLIETSGRVGKVALALGDQLLAERQLDESRRHARDLAPTVRDLLACHSWEISSLAAVIVSRGPGSYTGLRVGIMSAKALAFATGCKLLAVDTFAAIARQTPDACEAVEIIADAQQGRVYCQRFRRDAEANWNADTDLAIRDFAAWLGDVPDAAWISGPGLNMHEVDLSKHRLVEVSRREAECGSLLACGLEKLKRGENADIWTLEPLYLRPSAAEQQWKDKLPKP